MLWNVKKLRARLQYACHSVGDLQLDEFYTQTQHASGGASRRIAVVNANIPT